MTYQSYHDGVENLLNQFKSIYSSLNSEYQTYLLRAIGAVYIDIELHSEALKFVLESGLVRDQDKLRGLYSLRRCYGREETWAYLVDPTDNYWEQLFEIYGSGFSAQDITELPNTFASKIHYDKVYEFYYSMDGHKTSSNERSVNETLENIQVKVQWLDNNYDDIGTYLDNYFYSSTPSPSQQDMSDDETSEYNMYNYIWIVLLILVVLLCLTLGFRWIWKKKLSKHKQVFLGYKKQVNQGDDSDTKAMISDDKEFNMTLNMNSIDDDQYDEDDANL